MVTETVRSREHASARNSEASIAPSSSHCVHSLSGSGWGVARLSVLKTMMSPLIFLSKLDGSLCFETAVAFAPLAWAVELATASADSLSTPPTTVGAPPSTDFISR